MSYSGIPGAVMKLMISLNAKKRINRTIHRYCNHEYKLFKKAVESSIPSDYVWKESIRYQYISDSSIIETNNNIGVFSYTSARDDVAVPSSQIIV